MKSDEAVLEAFHDSLFLNLIKLLFKERPPRRLETLRFLFARKLELFCAACLISRLLFSLFGSRHQNQRKHQQQHRSSPPGGPIRQRTCQTLKWSKPAL